MTDKDGVIAGTPPYQDQTGPAEQVAPDQNPVKQPHVARRFNPLQSRV